MVWTSAQRDTYSSRWIIEETFRILKQEWGWTDCQLHDEASYKRYLYFTFIVFFTPCRIKEESDKTIYNIRQNVTLGHITFSTTRVKRLLRIA